MSNTIELVAESRQNVGKGASRRLRRLQDKFPAIIYGGDKPPQNIELEHRIISKALQNTSIYSKVITLVVDGKKEPVILKALQRHVFKPKILHIDFQRVDKHHELHINLPIHYLNEESAVGVREGGVLHVEHHIEVTCLAQNLPEFIEIDLAELKINETLHLSAIKLPKGVTSVALKHDNDIALATISSPKAVAESEDMPALAKDESGLDTATEETNSEEEQE